MNKPSAFLTGAVLLFVIAGQHVTAVRATPPATVVRTFHPAVPKGRPVAGSCWVTSIATNRPGAYRCMSGNAISDPCFTTSTPDIVVCDADPANGKAGFAMRIHGPLPVSQPVLGSVMPWLLKLSDGTTCSPLTGTRPFVAKIVVGYGCAAAKKMPDDQYVGLADRLDTKGALWRAQRVVYRAGAKGTVLVSASWVPVAAAWR